MTGSTIVHELDESTTREDILKDCILKHKSTKSRNIELVRTEKESTEEYEYIDEVVGTSHTHVFDNKQK